MFKGFKTVSFNLSMIVAGLFQNSEFSLPPEAQAAVETLLMSVLGVPALNGPALIIVGVIGILLRSMTTTKMGRQA